MPATKYTYSISSDFQVQQVDLIRLTGEIQASDIGATHTHIDTTGDDCDIWFAEALPAEDQAVLDGLVAGHAPAAIAEKNFLVAEYANPRSVLVKETWYGTDNGDGTYSAPVEETVYTYTDQNKALLSKTITPLYADGVPSGPPETWEYVEENNKKIMKKVSA